MKAKDLIKILETDPEADVLTKADNYELRGATVEVRSCSLLPFTKSEDRFRDDFDGGSYSHTVYHYDPEKGVKAFSIGG